jgi:dolichyl-diphosphooligosaccharide--protein glycosyltransferase
MAPRSPTVVASSPSAAALKWLAMENVLTWSILAACMFLAFMSRLFAVLRFESVIHEFDPYFNYRTTQYLVNNGAYDFHNWFDDRAWYPLGRIIGGTIYPGLMATSAVLYNALHYINITIDIRNVCVFLAPLFSSLTVMSTYALTRELHSKAAGLTAAAFVAIVPGYISRSVAGSYDNEGIAIFALIFTFYLWIKAVKTGSMMWAGATALAYFYMVSAWGGYVFIINIIPLHVLALMITGRFSHRVYVAYSTLYCLGTLFSMQISFVGFQPVLSSEHMGALGAFGLCQLLAFANYVRSVLSEEQFTVLYKTVIIGGGGTVLAVGLILQFIGKIAPWTGRFYSLLDPTYAKEHIPIIASVSEHQPTTWSSFFFDLQLLAMLFPVGMYFCFRKLTDHNMFIIIYGCFSIYFAGVMVRLMLVLAPVMCVLGAIAITETLTQNWKNIEEPTTKKEQKEAKRVGDERNKQKKRVATGALILVTVLLCLYSFHCLWVTAEAYSSPSIVLAAKGGNGRHIFDDFREAYFWLRQNTPEDAKIMSWWDYGYQITAMANRTILVDNNTWNNTHIATVGRAMASTEENAFPILQALDVDYILIIFGGLTGYASDDINKFLWMIRIGGSVYPEIKEKDYMAKSGEYKIDRAAPSVMTSSLMYKLCYYRFGTVHTDSGKPSGWDRVRTAEIGVKDFELDTVEEAYTTEHWIVRIYKVKKPDNRSGSF